MCRKTIEQQSACFRLTDFFLMLCGRSESHTLIGLYMRNSMMSHLKTCPLRNPSSILDFLLSLWYLAISVLEMKNRFLSTCSFLEHMLQICIGWFHWLKTWCIFFCFIFLVEAVYCCSVVNRSCMCHLHQNLQVPWWKCDSRDMQVHTKHLKLNKEV